SSFEYTDAKQALQRAQANYQSVQSVNAQRITRANTEIGQITRRATDGNLGPVEISRVTALQKNIQFWQADTAAARRAVETAESKQAAAMYAWRSAEAENLERTTKELRVAVASAADTDAKVTARNQESEKGAGPLFRSTLINQYRTYRRITSNPSHPDYAA